jgi:hypothetical protein
MKTFDLRMHGVNIRIVIPNSITYYIILEKVFTNRKNFI